MPSELAIRLCSKYEGRGVQYVSTTFSGSDGIMEAKCALIVAAKILLGQIQQFPGVDIQPTLEQTVASELDAHGLQFL